MQVLPLSAQGFSGLARVDAAASSVRATDQGARLQLRLSQGVPWRAYTLDGPPRLVLDFREVDFSSLKGAEFVGGDVASYYSDHFNYRCWFSRLISSI